MGKMMKRYAVEVKLDKRLFTHLWRASGITIAESNNVSIGQIMSRSGHNNIQSLKPYINNKKDETTRKISEALNPEHKLTKIVVKKQEPMPQPEPPSIQDNSLRELELKLIQQLANGEISNKVYNDAIGRLENLNKHPTTEVQGYS